MHAPILAVTAMLAATPAAAASPRLTAPVDGSVTRGFAYAGDPFARGHHRGLDLAAEPGSPVRAACSGRVAFAGRAGPSGGVVTIRCGAWNVTHLPLRAVAVRTGEAVPAGTRIGEAAAARGHAGLHLGVRRAGDPLGYVDPAPLLGPAPPAPPPVAGPAPRRSPRAAPPRAALRPAPLPATPSRPGSSPAARARAAGLAPWPVWAGLVLLLSGALGAGAARAGRRRRAPLPTAVVREVR